MKNIDYENTSQENKLGCFYFEGIDCIFPWRANVKKFPSCKHLKLVRPDRFEGIDFKSFESLQRLDLSYCDSKVLK